MSTNPRRAVLQRVPIDGALPSLVALFHKTVDIAGTGKRKIDGSYAATRLKQTMTSKWANDTVTLHIYKNPVASNGEGWAVATAPQPDRYKHIVDVQKEAVAREGGLRQVFPPNPAPL